MRPTLWMLLISAPLAALSFCLPAFAQTTPNPCTDGIELFGKGRVEQAKGELLRCVETNAQHPRAAEATLTLGKIALYHQDFIEAEGRFLAVVERFSSSEFASEARHLANVARAQAKEAGKPVPESSPAVPAEAAVQTPTPLVLGPEALKFRSLSPSLGTSAGPQRGALEKEVLELGDHLSLEEAKALLAETTDLFARGVLQFRAGALLAHIQAKPEATLMLKAFSEAQPMHPLTAKAKVLLDTLRALGSVNPMKIGVLLPLSGRFEPFGKRTKEAIDLAATEIAARSNGAISFVYRDTKGDELEAARALEQLVLQDGVIGVVGPLMSLEAEIVAYRAEELGVPIVSLSARDGLVDLGSYIFRSAMTARMQARAMVDYAWDVLGKRQFAIMQPMHAYGEELAYAFWEEVRRRGGMVTGFERYEDDQTTFKNEIQRLSGRNVLSLGDCTGGTAAGSPKGVNCARVNYTYNDRGWPHPDFDALFIPDYPKQVGMIVPSLPLEEVEIDTKTKSNYMMVRRKGGHLGRKVKMVQLLGANGWNQDKLREYGGKWVDGSIFCDGFYAKEEANVVVSAFIQTFQRDYNRPPGTIEAYAYDAAGVLAHLIETAQPKTRDALRDALYAMERYEGATGEFRFDKNGEMLNELVILMQRKDGIVPAPMTLQIGSSGYWIDDGVPVPVDDEGNTEEKEKTP